MGRPLFVGVDVGTSSTKAVAVDLAGTVVAESVREHAVQRPQPGWVEMDGEVWWGDFVATVREVVGEVDAADVAAVGVSGMGPCVLLTDASDRPLRPAILYGVDTRSTQQIRRLEDELGATEVLSRCGSPLSSQAAGAKVAWVAESEPDVYARAQRLFMPSSWLVRRLTGAYVLDHHSASQCTPMYDIQALSWHDPWAKKVAPGVELPTLLWPGEVAGTITEEAAGRTGLPTGIPVITGTIDAWMEAVSVGAQNVGDLMVMYGTTMFLVHTVDAPITSTSLWGTVGAFPGTRSLAGGMATSGAITAWLRDLLAAPAYDDLLREAEVSGPGANGLLMLPYFAGERTPILDPDARGVIAGLTLDHTRGDLYRATLEAVALGARHNIDTMEDAGGHVQRLVAVGGGTRGSLWTQIVSDVTGREQLVPSQTVGASYGGAFLAALAVTEVDILKWNPPATIVQPRPELASFYDEMFALYTDLYAQSRSVVHALARRQRRAATQQPQLDNEGTP